MTGAVRLASAAPEVTLLAALALSGELAVLGELSAELTPVTAHLAPTHAEAPTVFILNLNKTV